MIREVELASYLPLFMQKYQEPVEALKAEDPEFRAVWEAADRILYNHFISTADEYGISRFERILDIFPSGEDTLESRRLRVQTKWFTALPYTWRMLIRKMKILCGDSRFRVYMPAGTWYNVMVCVSIEPQTEPLLKETERLLESFLPLNLRYQVVGETVRTKNTGIYAGAAGSLHVKIKAGPESVQFSMTREVTVKTGNGIMEHIRVSYAPERKE